MKSQWTVEFVNLCHCSYNSINIRYFKIFPFHCLLAMKWWGTSSPGLWTRRSRLDPAPQICYKKSWDDCADIWSSAAGEGGLIIFLLNNLKFPTVVQQIKSIGVSLWVGTEHWHVLVSVPGAEMRARPGMGQILRHHDIMTCDHNWATPHNSHQMTWHQAKPAHINECKSFKMSHCSGRFEFRLHDT